MEKLAENVDNFAKWWSEVDMALSQAEKSTSGLRPGKDKIRVKWMQRTWTTIRDDYKQYKGQVCLSIVIIIGLLNNILLSRSFSFKTITDRQS